ncbi:hypothetical protein ACQP2F_21285 [Actinoplanes sp. CA-030573]|uniref:hypothetical protein n=1 Tax=Actinoplanes sp. CA-030573 TaxID=3239898 RepID=UPI003D93BFFC
MNRRRAAPAAGIVLVRRTGPAASRRKRDAGRRPTAGGNVNANGLRLTLCGDGLDDSRVAELTRNLRETLLDVGDVAVGPAGEPPGSLVVTPAPVLVTSVLEVIASWLRRQPADVEIGIDGVRFKGTVTYEQRNALVHAYLNRSGEESS